LVNTEIPIVNFVSKKLSDVTPGFEVIV